MRLAGDWAPSGRQVAPLPWSGLLLANLEGPVLASNHGITPIPKAGPHLCHRDLPRGLVDCVMALANNHVMDYGDAGLCQTLQQLTSANIQGLGAGQNVTEAAKPLIINWRGTRIGILARCEVQFGMATRRCGGVAAFDATVYRAIHNLNRETDFVIASIHAAAEMCPWPSPDRQDAWRALVDAGADVVHGHHAHVPQGWEAYEGGLIFYGLGNLCIDPAAWSGHAQALWSLVPELSWDSGQVTMRAATAVIEDSGQSLHIRDADPVEAQAHQAYLAECNRPLADRPALEALWQEVSVRQYWAYYADWLRFERPVAETRIGLRHCAHELLQRIRSPWLQVESPPSPRPAVHKGQYLLWHVLFACESHSEAIATALGVLGGALEDLRSDETARLVDAMMPSMT